MNDKNLSNNELYEKLAGLLDIKLNEIKSEIKSIKNTVFKLDNKCNELEKRIINLDRKVRKNNIIIFGLEEVSEKNLLNYVLKKLNETLHIDLRDTDINNIYKIGSKNTILLEFISHLRKQLVFKNIKKLKGSNISITNDLCPEDQNNRKILYENLKEARKRNLTAIIKNNKLYVNNEAFTADQLINKENTTETEEVDISIFANKSPKPNSSSAPATPRAVTNREIVLEYQTNASAVPSNQNVQHSSPVSVFPTTNENTTLNGELSNLAKERKGSTSTETRILRNNKATKK